MPKLPRPLEARQLALFETPPPSAAEVARKAVEVTRTAVEMAREAVEIAENAEIKVLGGKCIACGEQELRQLRVDCGRSGRRPPKVLCYRCQRWR